MTDPSAVPPFEPTKCLAARARCEELLSLGKGVSRSVREMLESCVRACALAAEESQLGSGFRRKVCALCAVLCRACAEECRLQGGELFAQCADACDQAARECHGIALET